MYKIIPILLLLAFYVCICHAQTPSATDYSVQSYLISPSLAGNFLFIEGLHSKQDCSTSFQFSARYRNTNTNLSNARDRPKSIGIAIDGFLPNKKFGVGLQLNHQSFHLFEETQAKLSYQYTVGKMNGDNLFFVSIGASAGLSQKQININAATVKDISDPAISDFAVSNLDGVVDFGVTSLLQFGKKQDFIQADFSLLNMQTSKGDYGQFNYTAPTLFNAGLKMRIYTDTDHFFALEPLCLIQLPFSKTTNLASYNIGTNLLISPFGSNPIDQQQDLRLSLGVTGHYLPSNENKWAFSVQTGIQFSQHIKGGLGYTFTNIPTGNSAQLNLSYILN